MIIGGCSSWMVITGGTSGMIKRHVSSWMAGIRGTSGMIIGVSVHGWQS